MPFIKSVRFWRIGDFMISGQVVVQFSKAKTPVLKHRDVMGATDLPRQPRVPSASCIEVVGENSVHGSDAPETPDRIAQFFARATEIVG